MAKQSTFGNMAVSLSVICLVCAAVLGAVYCITEKPIADAELAKVNNAIASVVPAFDNNPSDEMQIFGDSKVYTASCGGSIVGYAIQVKSSGFGGPLQMMVGFTPDGTVYNTSVISHSETPGLGAKITDANVAPRAQVIGKNPAVNNISVSKDGGEIDAITASTITSRAFLKGVNIAYEVFRQIPQSVQQPEAGSSEPQITESNESEQ